MDNCLELWERVKETLHAESDIPELSFNTWIQPIQPMGINGNTLTLVVPQVLHMNILKQKYILYIDSALRVISPSKHYNIEVITQATADQTAKQTPSNGVSSIMLNPYYTFDTFVIGKSNNFAHAAALAAAEAPAKEINPLFIYGDTGLGKTHLMHAIGNYIVSQNPDAKVLYVSSEKFIVDLINAIRTNKNEEFRRKYRNVDVLMIDDIQFIAGKQSTQEEIFHTFNDLYSCNKQIIISSDKPPKEIPTLEERLRSRFEWGLIADIQPPDYETRMAILRQKAEADGLDFPDDVLELIAVRVEANIRELEGSLKRIMMFSTITGREINYELAKEALKDFFSERDKKVYPKTIIETVARFYNLKPEDLLAKRRDKAVALARQVAMYLMRELTDLSLPNIGAEFGGRDHTTVIHGINKITAMADDDLAFKTELANLKKRIQGT